MYMRALLLGFIVLTAQIARAESPAVLVFSKTTGFRHTSIKPGIKALTELGKEHGFSVESTEDARAFNAKNLAHYAAVVFLSTTGNVLNTRQQQAFETYIGSGGGFVGIHSAADTEYNWPWYGLLVGAWFDSHGAIQDAAVIPTEPFGAAALPSPWMRHDEWYNFKRLPHNVRVVLKLDTDTFKGSKHEDDHPIAWYHDVGRGRAFYTGLGHTNESFAEPLFLAHVLDGIRYAMGPAAPALPPR